MTKLPPPITPTDGQSFDEDSRDLAFGAIPDPAAELEALEAMAAEAERESAHSEQDIPREFADAYAGTPGSPPVTDKGLSTLKLRPKKLSHRLKFIAHLAAMGCTQKDICARTGYTSSRVSILLNSPIVSNEVERERKYIFDRDPDQAMRTMIPVGLEKISQVLQYETNDFKTLKTQSEVAFQIFERTHGKSKQRVEVGGNLLSEIFNLLDKRTLPAEGAALEAPSRAFDEAEIVDDAQELPAEPDRFDAILDKSLKESL